MSKIGNRNRQLLLSSRPRPAAWTRTVQAAATIRAITWAVPAYTLADGSGGLIEAALYDENGVILGRSGVRDLPPGGATVTLGLLPVAWDGGTVTAAIWLSKIAAGRITLASENFPALSGKPTISGATGGDGTVAVVARADYTATWRPGGAWWHEEDGPIFWLGADASTGDAWGNRWYGGGLVVSADAGTADSGAATWTTLMAVPTMIYDGEALYRIEVDRSSTPRLLALTSYGRILHTDNLTAGAVWTDVTPTLRRTAGRALAWGLAVWQGKVWAGEYTAAPHELPDGPRVYSCDLASLASDNWTLSLFNDGARHLHDLTPVGTDLYAVFGDAGFTGIGIWKLAAAGIGGGPGDGGTDSNDDWQYYAPSGSVEYGEGRPSIYPVSLAAVIGVAGIADVLLGAGDQPGTHITTTPIQTLATGSRFAVGVQIKQPENGMSGETARAVVLDDDDILYWTSAETTDYALYCAPAPYSGAVRLKSNFPGLIMRSIYLPGWTVVLNARQRWAVAALE